MFNGVYKLFSRDLAIDHDRRMKNAVTGIRAGRDLSRHDGAAILIRHCVLVIRGQQMAAT